MNDLISRTSLLRTLNDWWLSETPNGRVLLIGGEPQRTPAMKDIEQFMIAVENEPTAYDPDKIAEQIHEYFKGEIDTLNGKAPWDILKHNKAVCEIVKGGAV